VSLGDAPTALAPIVIRPADEWMSSAAAPAPPAALAAILTPVAIAPSPAKYGRAGSLAPDKPERPRVFFRALPEAFLLPLRGPSLRGLGVASVLGASAMALGVLGLAVGPATVALAVALACGLVGLVLQIAGGCLWAAASGARTAAPLPGELMAHYLGPGLGIFVAQASLASFGTWAIDGLTIRGVPIALRVGFGIFLALYGVVGFALSAANGSARGYLDVARIVRVVVGAPVRVLFIGMIGGFVQSAAMLGATLQMLAAYETSAPLVLVLCLGVLGPAVSFAFAYGAAISAAMMGLLFHAKPDLSG
jgi:hypothetical protein